VKATCWGLAEAAGHDSPYRMQALLRSYRWDWKELRAELPTLAFAWLPCGPGDLIGPGIAVDETAQLKDGDATACVAPQHAGCTGHVENCLTTVFSAWVTTSGQAWADFDVFMPQRWEKAPGRGIPDKLERKTKPQLAIAQLARLLDAGQPAKWAAYDEVYGRSGELRRFCESRGLAYVAVIPRDFRITLPSGAVIKAEEATADAVFEQRSCGNGAKGPRFADWALTATSSPRHFLLIRRLGTPPWPRSPSCGRQLSATTCAATSPSPAPPPAQATTTAATTRTARTTSAVLTGASRSVTRPSPPAPGSPARRASARSGSPSPRPPASNAWPGTTPPG
jgi:hypothetical protein